jgi:hypothetical protein
LLNTVTRILTRTNTFDHITPVLAWLPLFFLSSLHWLPVKARADFKVLLLTYKALHGLTPTVPISPICSLPYIPTLRSQEAGLISKQLDAELSPKELSFWSAGPCESLYSRLISSDPGVRR